MVKQPQASRYAKDTDRINEMKEVYEMFHIEHLRVTEIMSKKGMTQYKVYHFLRTFAAECATRSRKSNYLALVGGV